MGGVQGVNFSVYLDRRVFVMKTAFMGAAILKSSLGYMTL